MKIILARTHSQRYADAEVKVYRIVNSIDSFIVSLHYGALHTYVDVRRDIQRTLIRNIL